MYIYIYIFTYIHICIYMYTNKNICKHIPTLYFEFHIWMDRAVLAQNEQVWRRSTICAKLCYFALQETTRWRAWSADEPASRAPASRALSRICSALAARMNEYWSFY